MTSPTPLEIAHSQIGVKEATGKNDGDPSERYMGGRREAWCGHFVAWCFSQAGTPLPEYIPPRAPGPDGKGEAWDPLASVATLLSVCRKHGWTFQDDTQSPRPGDIVFLSERGLSDKSASPTAGHVGIVATVTARTVQSIDGNWGNAVALVSRARGDKTIVGYARPFLGA